MTAWKRLADYSAAAGDDTADLPDDERTRAVISRADAVLASLDGLGTVLTGRWEDDNPPGSPR